MPENPTTTVHPITLAERDVAEATDRLVTAAVAEISAALQREHTYRVRNDKLAQILVGTAALCHAVLNHQHTHARDLARDINVEIAKLQKG